MYTIFRGNKILCLIRTYGDLTMTHGYLTRTYGDLKRAYDDLTRTYGYLTGLQALTKHGEVLYPRGSHKMEIL